MDLELDTLSDALCVREFDSSFHEQRRNSELTPAICLANLSLTYLVSEIELVHA